MSASDAAGGQRRLEEFVAPGQQQRCEAYADSTGERCQHDALVGIPYCGLHRHLLDDVDLTRS